MKQVITVGPNGELFGLDHKNKGVQLRDFGHAETKRATLIEWDSAEQGWIIRSFTPGTETTDPTTGDPWTVTDWENSTPWNCPLPASAEIRDGSDVLLFADYDEAVAAEVVVIQARQTAAEGLESITP